ncbi:hypothetical protein L1887_04712 [Cichorium endivia]|nr:hypothetical protein L1887_04712 [Cichorium endivia]
MVMVVGRNMLRARTVMRGNTILSTFFFAQFLFYLASQAIYFGYKTSLLVHRQMPTHGFCGSVIVFVPKFRDSVYLPG